MLYWCHPCVMPISITMQEFTKHVLDASLAAQSTLDAAVDQLGDDDLADGVYITAVSMLLADYIARALYASSDSVPSVERVVQAIKEYPFEDVVEVVLTGLAGAVTEAQGLEVVPQRPVD